ncbi:MAG: DUF4406 domain-containing protein [Campylobacteraceae bacterium]|jgi:hypothetical protein|nr:DUF4406 domain-containing protein [Campylobacteraceae bacterium]
MKKVMISQPMKGKTIEEIRAEREETKTRLNELGYEVIDTIIPEAEKVSTNNKALWFLGKSLQLMSEVDLVYFMKGWDKARGCLIEKQAAENYGLEIIEQLK